MECSPNDSEFPSVCGVPGPRSASDEASYRRHGDSVVANSFRSPNAPALHAQHAYQSQGQVTTFGAAHFGSTHPQGLSPMQQPHFFGFGPPHMHSHVSAAPAASYPGPPPGTPWSSSSQSYIPWTSSPTMHSSLASGAAPSHGAGGSFGVPLFRPPGASPHGIQAHFPGYTHHQGQDLRQNHHQSSYLKPLQYSPNAMPPSFATIGAGMALPILPPRTPTAHSSSSHGRSVTRGER